MDFKSFDLLTPNEKEARFSLADQDSSISDLTRRLKEETKLKNLILKLGERGSFASGKGYAGGLTIPTFCSKVIDAVGAGDALLAYSTLAMLATKSVFIASIIGSAAAACECEKDGNITINPDEVIKKINSIEEMTGYKSSYKA